MTNWAFYFAIFGLVMLGVGYVIGWLVHVPLPSDDETRTAKTDAAPEVEDEEEIVGEAFVVTGRPRKPTWRQRRKELEAAARTKRKRLEEWSD